MVFNSATFLFAFLPIVISVYFHMDYYLFNQFPDSTNRAIDKTGMMVDGENSTIQSYAHTNILSDEELKELGSAYPIY